MGQETVTKQKLLVFHPALAPYRVDFFNAIDNKFDAAFYFNLKNVADQKFDQEAIKYSCNFNANYLQRGFDLFGRSFRRGIISIIQREKPDIILCSEYGPVTIIVFIYSMLLNNKFKLYSISDDSIDNSINRKGFRAFLRNIISRNIDGVIFPSREVCTWFNKNVSAKVKTFELPIVHNDIVFRDKIVSSLNVANSYLQTYHLAGKKIVLFVGRLVEVKNLKLLLSAAAKLKNSDWVLVIVGDGVLLNDLEAQSVKLNIAEKTLFVGRKEGAELYAWFSIAQIFVLPSVYEPFGAVVNEALLGGCIVLCSELAGAASLINQNNGKLFNPHDENELVSCLKNSLNEVDSTMQGITEIRPNRMPFSFNNKIEVLLNNF